MKTKGIYYFIVSLIIAIAGFCSANYTGIELPDTTSYVDIANQGFASPFVSVRPAIYPSIIHLATGLSEPNRNAIIVFIQVVFYVFSAIFIFWLLNRDGVKAKQSIAFIAILVIVAFLNPQSLNYNSIILPENISLFFILVVAYLVSKETVSWRSSILLGFLLVIPMLIKPVWMFIVLIPFVFNLKNLTNKCILKLSILIPVIIATLLFGVHQWVIQKNQQSGKLVATTMDVNLNLALIRGGFIQGTEGSSLYQYLSNEGLIQEISARQWTNSKEEFESFTRIKDIIPWKEREDAQFWKSAITKPTNFFGFLLTQSKRVVKFYTNSPTGVLLNIKSIDYLYQVSYDKLHKWLVFPIFLILTFRALFFNLSKAEFVLWLIILFSSLVITFFTYQDPHFSRMRSAIEPILLILIGLEIGRLYNQLFKWIRGRKYHTEEQIFIN